MKRSYFGGYLSGICLVVALGVAAPASAESVAEEPVVVAVVQPDQAAEKGALSLTHESKGVDEPLYAGTSMWFLLSIALLGSIAVQRRTDNTE